MHQVKCTILSPDGIRLPRPPQVQPTPKWTSCDGDPRRNSSENFVHLNMPISCLFRNYLFLCLSLWANIGFCQPNTFQGEYWNGGQTTEDAYQFLQIHYKRSGEIFFYIEVGRGAPSYNSGALYGRLVTNKRTGHLQYLAKDTTADCSLDFAMTDNKIVVKTINGDCPFGYGVFADGTYKLKKKSNPMYFNDRSGQKIYFDKTDPEHYEF